MTGSPSPRFDDVDWGSVYSRLQAYATWKAARVHVTGAGPLPLGWRPEDAVQHAITQTLGGGRPWNQAANPELIDHLKAAVDSVVWNLVQRTEHRNRVPESVEDHLGDISDAGPDAETALADGECADALVTICEHVVGDDERFDVVRMGIEDGESRAVVAEMIGGSVEEVYAMTKTFTRRMRRALVEHPCWSDLVDAPRR